MLKRIISGHYFSYPAQTFSGKITTLYPKGRRDHKTLILDAVL